MKVPRGVSLEYTEYRVQIEPNKNEEESPVQYPYSIRTDPSIHTEWVISPKSQLQKGLESYLYCGIKVLSYCPVPALAIGVDLIGSPPLFLVFLVFPHGSFS